MHEPKYSKPAVINLRNRLEGLFEWASYDGVEATDNRGRQVPKEFAPIFKQSVEVITQLQVQLDKAAFANASYEQRCKYLEKQLQQTEEYLKTSLTM